MLEKTPSRQLRALPLFCLRMYCNLLPILTTVLTDFVLMDCTKGKAAARRLAEPWHLVAQCISTTTRQER